MDCSLPGSSVNGALQARILSWVAVPSSTGSSPPRDRNRVSCSYFTPSGFLTAEPPGKPQTHMLLLLSRFSHADSVQPHRWRPIRHPQSLGFSRQEQWSGLPFPSPVHGSENWKWSRSVVSDSSWPHGLQPTRLLHPCDFPGKSTGVGCHCLLCQTHICVYKYTSLQFLCKKIKLLIL